MTFTDEDIRALAMTYALRGFVSITAEVSAYVGQGILRSRGADVDLLDENPNVRDLIGSTNLGHWERVIALALWEARGQEGEKERPGTKLPETR